MKKRILIGYADYEDSHSLAAKCLFNYLDNKKEFIVKIINLSKISNNMSRFSNDIFYKVNKRDGFNGYLYGLLNNNSLSKSSLKLSIKAFDNEELRNEIISFNPDFIITTHFYMNYICGFYKRENLINAKILSIITDFRSHKWWTINYSDVDYFIVSNKAVKKDLISSGVSSDKIFLFGIPNNYILSDLDSRENILKRYNISGKNPIYLFFSDNYRKNISFAFFKALVKSNFKIDIIFICEDSLLKNKCDEFILNNGIKNTVVLGFSKDIHNILSITDVVIAYPNSISLNNILMFKKPSILLPSLGMVEYRNCHYMIKKHFSIKVSSPSSLVKKVNSCLSYSFIINSMKNKLSNLDDFNSCSSIYEFIKNK